MTVTHHAGYHRQLTQVVTKTEILVGKTTKQSAGDFNKYTSKCDMKRDGWKLFRPEAYDIKLMEKKSDGTII